MQAPRSSFLKSVLHASQTSKFAPHLAQLVSLQIVHFLSAFSPWPSWQVVVSTWTQTSSADLLKPDLHEAHFKWFSRQFAQFISLQTSHFFSKMLTPWPSGQVVEEETHFPSLLTVNPSLQVVHFWKFSLQSVQEASKHFWQELFVRSFPVPIGQLYWIQIYLSSMNPS